MSVYSRESNKNSSKLAGWRRAKAAGAAKVATHSEPSSHLTLKVKDFMAVLIALLALCASVLSLYLQHAYQRAELSMKIFELTIGSDERCRVDMALFNSGNRNVAFMRAFLTQSKTSTTSTDSTSASTSTTTTTSTLDGVAYFAADLPQAAFAIKGGEVKLHSFAFDNCNPRTLRTHAERSGRTDLWLETETLSHDGTLSEVKIELAKIRAEKDSLVLSLTLDGRFDLLADKSQYVGKAERRTEDLQITGGDENWTVKHTRSSSFSYQEADGQ